MFIRALRSWIIQHPIISFLILAYATTAALAFVPEALTEPGLLPGGATPHGVLENVAQNWSLIFTLFLPALVIMILLNDVAEEVGWTGFTFARLQDRYDPLRAALLATGFFWLYHVSSFYVETRSLRSVREAD